jgi:O-methyltransferase involved in polyketide biosynthesis
MGSVGGTDRLLAAGLDPTLPTAWLAEGLLYYLEPSCVDARPQVAQSLLDRGVQLLHDC